VAARLARVRCGGGIKALASYLGHADPGFTLRVYTHLMPASEERTRRVIDDLFDGARRTLDALETP
jgi:integrase